MQTRTRDKILADQGKEFLDYLKETFINDIEIHGFDLSDYVHADLVDSEVGVHILLFDEAHSKPKDWNKLNEICPQQDDNQTPAHYTEYFGNLVLYIPFFA